MASNNYLGTKDIQEMFPEVFNKRLPYNNKDKVKNYEITNPGCSVTVNVKNGSAIVNVTNIYR
jgi:hypothetical protein